MKKYNFTCKESVRLSRKFTKEENDNKNDRCYMIKINDKFVWYKNNPPGLYSILLDFPFLSCFDILDKLWKTYPKNRITLSKDGKYSLSIDYFVYSDLNLNKLLYKVAIKHLSDLSKPNLTL